MSISVLLVGEAKVRERVPGAAPTVEARGWPSVFLCPPGIGRGLPQGLSGKSPYRMAAPVDRGARLQGP